MISPREHGPGRSAPAPVGSPDYQTRENSVSLGALVAIVVSGTIILAIGLAFLGSWLSRRRAGCKARAGREGTPSVDRDYPAVRERSVSRKLQKAGSSASVAEGLSPIRRWRSLPLLPRVFTGHFVRTSSPNWPSELVHTGRRNPSWIDEDALHGPEMRVHSRFSWGGKIRDSWPLGNIAPTLPKLHQGHPYDRRPEEDALFGIDHVRTAYGQLRMYSRVLPEPPKPALAPGLERQHSRTASSASTGYAHSDRQRQNLGQSSNPASPTRPLPKTPSKRGRQLSTDSTLAEILRSTEERLQEGRTAVKSMVMTSPDKMGTSKESLLDHRDTTAEVWPLSRSLAQPRTPSPKKLILSRSATIGHGRQTSETSNTSESDSPLDEILFRIPDCPAGLTSPSRNQRKLDPEVQPLPPRSAHSSLSSALSTVYSEDERSEGVKTATNTPRDFTAQNIQSIMVSPESMADPFSPASSLPITRPITNHGWPPRQHKAQDLFRESLERSQRLRGMTLGQTISRPPEVNLPPCPAPSGCKPLLSSPVSSVADSRPGFVSSLVVALDNQSSFATSKILVKTSPGAQGLQPAGHSRLNSMTSPAPASSSTLIGPREQPGHPSYPGAKRDPTEPDSRDSTSTLRPPSPSRASCSSPSPSPLPLRHSASVSSSIYSQDCSDPLANTASLLNTASFRANSLLSLTTTSSPPPFPSPTRTPSPGKGASSSRSTSLALTVAELRRMNSCTSTASSNGGAAAFTPGHRCSGSRKYLSLGGPLGSSLPASGGRKLGDGSGSPGAGRSARRDTLIGVGGSPKRRVGHVRVASRKASVSGSIKTSVSSGTVTAGAAGVGMEEKENELHHAGGFAMPRVEFTFAAPAPGEDFVLRPRPCSEGSATPQHHHPKRRRYGSGKGSQESLGLYDQNGFLISTPMRGLSPVRAG